MELSYEHLRLRFGSKLITTGNNSCCYCGRLLCDVVIRGDAQLEKVNPA